MNNNFKEMIIKFIIPLVIIIIAFNYNTLVGTLLLVLYLIIRTYTGRQYIYAIKGKKAYTKGNAEEGLMWFEKAYNNGKTKARVAVSYSFLLLKSRNIDKAEQVLDNVFKKKLSVDEEMSAKSNYSLILWKKGQIDEAVVVLEEVFEKYKTTNIYGSLGYYYIIQGDYNKALKFNLEAYDYNSSDQVILDNLGQNYYLLGENEKAEKTYEDLLEYFPKFPDAYYNYGLVLIKKGDTVGAIENMKKALTYKFSFLGSISKQQVEDKLKELTEQ